jgi:hypothetical protein
MAFVVSKGTNWQPNSYVKVPFHLICCEYLTSSSKLLLMTLYNQVGFHPVNYSTLDRLLGIHRSTRLRCLAELRELGFINGSDNHLVLADPMPILTKLFKNGREDKVKVETILSYDDYIKKMLTPGEVGDEPVTLTKRDYMLEATEAWNRYRPKNYKRIRRISAPVIKALDIHMRDLGVPAHNYDEFFSILKAGIEKSEFWSLHNSSKTLQSITGIGTPTDKKRSNVYALFNEGADKPAQPTTEEDRDDTIVYPAAFRKVINEYDAAQHCYNEAYRNNKITPDVEAYVIRTEQALVDLGLDPGKFRMKYGMKTWPTNTPEPSQSRVINWEYDDQYDTAY